MQTLCCRFLESTGPTTSVLVLGGDFVERSATTPSQQVQERNQERSQLQDQLEELNKKYQESLKELKKQIENCRSEKKPEDEQTEEVGTGPFGF